MYLTSRNTNKIDTLVFIDSVNEIVTGKYGNGFKNSTFNKLLSPCHFQDESNVSGFVPVEVNIQFAEVLALATNQASATVIY